MPNRHAQFIGDILQAESADSRAKKSNAARGHLKKGRRSKARALYAAIAALTVAFVLTACGARIDTTMNVSNLGAGERVMVLSLGASDMSKLTGGSAAADASIRRHLPAPLVFSGLQPASGGVTATVTFPFTSTSDYKKKAADLLKAGGSGQPNTEFSVSDSTLVKGIVLREAYSSADLLQWMFKGLISDGVISSGDSSNMYELGTTNLNFGGATTSQSNMLNVKSVKNNGFDAVSMQTQIQDLGHITRTITYSVDSARYTAAREALTKFVNESAPAIAQMATPSQGTWTVTFAGDPAFISSATTKALGGSAAEFAVDLADAPDDASEKVLTITDNASCDAVCATSRPIMDTMTSASGYTPEKAAIDTSARKPVSFRYAPPITSVSAVFTLGINGSVDANVQFVIPKESTDAAGEGFAKLLNPDNGVGTLKTDRSDSSTTYTVTISGKNAEEFAAGYGKWARGASLTAVDTSGLFLHETGYKISPALQSLTGRHPVTDGVTSEIILPFGQWVTNSGGGTHNGFGVGNASVTVDGAGSALTVQASGLTLAGLIAAFILLAGGVIGLFLLVRHRHALRARLKTVRGRVDEALAEQRVLQFEANVLPPQPNGATASSLFTVGVAGGNEVVPHSVLNIPIPPSVELQRPGRTILDLPAVHTTAGQRTSLLDLERKTATDTRPSLLT